MSLRERTYTRYRILVIGLMCVTGTHFFISARVYWRYKKDLFYFVFGSFLNMTTRAITAIIMIAPTARRKSMAEGLYTFFNSTEYFWVCPAVIEMLVVVFAYSFRVNKTGCVPGKVRGG